MIKKLMALKIGSHNASSTESNDQSRRTATATNAMREPKFREETVSCIPAWRQCRRLSRFYSNGILLET